MLDGLAKKALAGARHASLRATHFLRGGRLSRDYLCTDGTLPRRAIGLILLRIREMEKRYVTVRPVTIWTLVSMSVGYFKP